MESILKFSPINKDSLFYSKWRYCLSFTLLEVSCLKHLDHKYIDSIIERRRYYREISHQRLTKAMWAGSTKIATIISKRNHEITEETVANLHYLADQLLNTTIDFKLVTSVDQAWVYTNDATLIEQLDDILFLNNRSYSEAVITRPKNSIKLKNPKYTHRSYFKNCKLNTDEKDNIRKFFINQQELRISPSMEMWFKDPFHRLQDYFFIDHNGNGLLVMLTLIKPNIIRKTVDIISAK